MSSDLLASKYPLATNFYKQWIVYDCVCFLENLLFSQNFLVVFSFELVSDPLEVKTQNLSQI